MENYEQKYKEVLAEARLLYNSDSIADKEWFANTFPELEEKENEDERIRKEILSEVSKAEDSLYVVFTPHKKEEWIAWIEKQKQEIPQECVFRPYAGCDIESAAVQAIEQIGILAEEIVLAFNGAYIPVNGKTTKEIVDNYNSWLEKQKPADKNEPTEIEPKFKTGDKVKKGYLTFTIEAITDDNYYKMTAYGKDGHQGCTEFLRIEAQDNLELVERKPINQSEEDEPNHVDWLTNVEEINGEDYGIDGLWHAQRILEKTLGEVEGYQSDDGILEHKAAIGAVKALYEQKPVELLSESVIDTEDKRMWSAISQGLSDVFEKVGWSDFGGIPIEEIQEWLDKQWEQKPTEWSEEDEKYLSAADMLIRHATTSSYGGKNKQEVIDWLKSLRPQNHWKPTEEQMKALASTQNGTIKYAILQNLYNDLKNL